MQKIIAAVNRKAEELLRESRRKAIHALIAFVPLIAFLSMNLAVFLLLSGILVYAWSEFARLEGKRIFIISDIKDLVFRKQDVNRFAMAPVTLALGALCSLFLFEPQVAAASIYSLAFGDSFACLMGKSFGKTKIPFAGEKTYVGFMSCFVTVFFITYGMFGMNLTLAVAAALTAALTELMPAGDYDNLILPVAVGFILTLLI